MPSYQNKEVSADVLTIARSARDIYLATVPRTKADAWEKLSNEERHAWIPYAMAAREAALELAAMKLEKHAADIVHCGDQFDQGGDIYSAYRPTMQAAEIVRSLKNNANRT